MLAACGARLSRGAPLLASLREMSRKRASSCATKGPAEKRSRPVQHVRSLEVVQVEPAASDDVVLRYEGLVPAQLLRRYKRFLADVQLGTARVPSSEGQEAEDEPTVVHVPNTGPMTGLLDRLPAPAMLSSSTSAKRKYAHTLEWIQPEPGTWVGVHSAKANVMVRHLLHHRMLTGLPPYDALQTEVKYGSDGKSRVDFVLHVGAQGPTTHVEVKSVTLAEDLPEGAGRIALFPDTVSERAQRHVRELTILAQAGAGAALVFLVQRGDCAAFAPCHEKDAEYGRLVVEAAAAGVAMVAVACQLDVAAGMVRYCGILPVQLTYKQPK